MGDVQESDPAGPQNDPQMKPLRPPAGFLGRRRGSAAHGGAGTARKIGRTAVRRIVIGIGFGMAVSLFIKK